MALKKAIIEEVSGVTPDLHHLADTTQLFERCIYTEDSEIRIEIEIEYHLNRETDVINFRGVENEKYLVVDSVEITTRIVDEASGETIYEGDNGWINELIQDKIY